jgi:hypothetical protein
MKFFFDCFTVVIVGGGNDDEKLPVISRLICKVQVKQQSHYRPGVAQRVPGS